MGGVTTVEEDIGKYRWLVKRIARQYVRPGFDLDDLVQEGYIALLDAARTWRPDGGSSFKAWANQTIVGALGRHGRANETSDALDGAVSMDATLDDEQGDGVGRTLHDVLGLPASQEDALGEAEQRAIVRAALESMPPSDRALLQSLIIDAQIQENIAVSLGIARRTVRDRCRHALEKLFRLLRHRVMTHRRAPPEAA